jgi:VWFA-related protein
MRNLLDPLVTMFHFARVVLACAVALTIIPSNQAQLPGNQQNPDTVNINTGEVLLDAVVRDKRGRLIKNLTAADFEVYEDGGRQEINSFRLITKSFAAETRADTSNPSDAQSRASDSGQTKSVRDSTSPAGVSAIALVFDRLTPDARYRATQAALSYVKDIADKDEFFGVFLTDFSVLVLQPFTEDRQLVAAAINQAGVHSSSLYFSKNQQRKEERLTDLLTGKMPSADRNGPPAGATQRMVEWLEMMERDQQGNATTRGLLFITSLLRPLPGRKAVILFSEGLILPPSVMKTFDAIINAANRNNVSFYTVDAAGLRAESKIAEISDEIKSSANLRMAQQASGAEGGGAMIGDLERNEDLLRLNPNSGLGQLADQTGGFLITDSNDLKTRLRKVDEDLHSYYLLSYRSNNQNYDGHFRKIEVRVKRSELEVQSRKGYFALNRTFASPVLSYEAPALAALDHAPNANSFLFYLRGFSFPERGRAGLVPVIADLPLSAFSFAVDQHKKVYQTDFSVVALLKDQTGQVVEKLSKQYLLSGPLDKLDEVKKEHILFYREANLASGRYTLETIGYDAPTGRSSVRTGTIEVSASDEGKLRLSDVAILNRAEPAGPSDEKKSNPFRVGNVIVSPNPGEPIHRSLKQVPFFFTVYIPAENSAPPKLIVELRQRGRNLAQMPGELPKPDESGRIQYLAELPLEKIPAGEYELRITVTNGATTLVRSAQLTIAD